MDPQTIQALMAVFQQGLQILQQAQGAAGAPGAPAMAGGAPGMPPTTPGDDDMGEDDDDQFADDAGNDGAAPDGMDDDMDGDGLGSASLHDRVSQLENHTGLKKSASGGTLGDRISALEDEILGVEYEGPMIQRVSQLEKAAGVGPKPKASNPVEDAPDEIPLDQLIKSAIQTGIQQAMAEKGITADVDDADLPDPATMRKAARQNGNHYGQRRASAPVQQTDEQLAKSAAALGWDEEDLDAEPSLGDVLLLQYHTQQMGEPMPFADDEDGDDD
jgi:hypothetical protein